MSWEGPQPVKLSLIAGGDLSGKQFYFVKLSADNTVVICAATTDIAIGVLQNKPASGATAEVVTVGVTKVSADATLAVGDLIGTSADGQADVKTAGETTQYVLGQVISGAAANGLATVVIDCSNPTRAGS